MEKSAREIRQSIEEIYERLDRVTPVDFDCGKLCGEICCVFDSDEYPNEDLALFLMPGEELMYEGSDEFELYYIDAKELDFPHSWKGDVCLVKCKNPPRCDRSIRPIQCRTFPLVPHISKDGEFLMQPNFHMNAQSLKITSHSGRTFCLKPLTCGKH